MTASMDSSSKVELASRLPALALLALSATCHPSFVKNARPDSGIRRTLGRVSTRPAWLKNVRPATSKAQLFATCARAAT